MVNYYHITYEGNKIGDMRTRGFETVFADNKEQVKQYAKKKGWAGVRISERYSLGKITEDQVKRNSHIPDLRAKVESY